MRTWRAGDAGLADEDRPHTLLRVPTEKGAIRPHGQKYVDWDDTTAKADKPPPPATDGDPIIGKPLGKYMVLDQLGEGGMGKVYLVEHIQLKKRFAAKLLSSEMSKRADAVARFQLEAESVSRLEHDNIV